MSGLVHQHRRLEPVPSPEPGAALLIVSSKGQRRDTNRRTMHRSSEMARFIAAIIAWPDASGKNDRGTERRPERRDQYSRVTDKIPRKRQNRNRAT